MLRHHGAHCVGRRASVKSLLVVCALASGCLSIRTATAQPVVRIVMPFPPGAAADTVARTIAPPLSRASNTN